MFDDVWLSNEDRKKTIRRWGIISVSFLMHSIIFFFVLYGSLFFTNGELPNLKVVDIYVSIVPKIPPSLRAAAIKTQKKTKVVDKDKKIKEIEESFNKLITPVEIPEEIIDEDEDLLVSDLDFGSGGGIEGGIEGGTDGGVIGGSLFGDFVEEKIEPVRLGTPPKLKKSVKPIYPPEALKRRVTGNLLLELTTDKFGKVIKCRVISGHPLLDKAGVDAVMQWVYEPHLVKGRPTPIIATILVEFSKTN